MVLPVGCSSWTFWYKAFDTVNFEILLHKLKLSGLKAPAVRWFRSYICGRSKVTKVGSEILDPALVTCGVPQGSILGPLLFTAYINDLPNCIEDQKVNLYADDTAVTFSSTDPTEMKVNSMNHLWNSVVGFQRISCHLMLKNLNLWSSEPTTKLIKLGISISIKVMRH